MTAIGIDLDIGDTVRAVDEILARHTSAEATIWDSLCDELEAIARIAMALDDMYLSLIVEIENIAGQPGPSPERIAIAIQQGRIYCSDRHLLGRLVELRAAIKVAAFHHDLHRRRYREIASTLRSIYERLGTYIVRLRRFQDGDDQESPGDRPRWDLKRLLDLLGRGNSAATGADDGVQIDDACEEAIRNFDSALSEHLLSLIGRARQQLMMAHFAT
jgi:hypothetical protein